MVRKLICLVLTAIVIVALISGRGANSSSSDLFTGFIDGKIPAYACDGSELWSSDLRWDANDWNCYHVGELVDVDNDGEDELLIASIGGGFFLDTRGDEVYVLSGEVYSCASGDSCGAPVGVMTYHLIDGEYWIVYADTLHSGREYYRAILLHGDEIVDSVEIKYFETSLGATEYYVNSSSVSDTEYLQVKTEIIGG